MELTADLSRARRRALAFATRHPRALRTAGDATLGVVVAAALVAITNREAGVGDAGALVLCAVTGLALAFRRRFPVGQYVVAMACMLTYDALDYPGGPIYAAAAGSALAMVAAAEPGRWMPTLVAGAGLVVAETVITDGWSGHVLVIGAVFVVAPVLFGEALRLRREQFRTAQTRAEYAERTREQEARRRVAEERLHIARDVHDVVGHSLATIALQAGVAEHLLADRAEKRQETADPDEQARRALADIRQLARRSLGELSAMLGVLREGEAARAPTPDVAQLPRLVDDVRAAGLPVTLEIENLNGEVPDVVGVAAYRIVQESLTNVVRHAGEGAHATVRVTARADGIEVEVADDGRGAAPGARDGNGLTGMRERAAALGGTFEAGTAPGGGFRVRALLPADGAR
jgi:signal transduction histidine kinase